VKFLNRIQAAGFGLGALNDAEDDDIDVYDGNLNKGRTRVAYDAFDHGDEVSSTVRRRSERTPKIPETASILASCSFKSNSDIYTLKRSTLFMQTFRDGTRVVTGFMLSDKPVAEDRW
jgi:G patch domain-containing protein 1